MDNKNTLATISNNLFNGINHLIENAQNRVAIFLNSETTLLYWSIGQYINTELKENERLKYGAKILATLSQQLTKKHGKFKPEYKAQMELYLRYLQKYEQQKHEEAPIGLLLCSERNTEHIELLLLDEENIRVAQYLNELPDKQWFIEKMHRAIEISKMNLDQN